MLFEVLWATYFEVNTWTPGQLRVIDTTIWCNTVRVDVRVSIGHGVAKVGVRYQANLCGVCEEVATTKDFLVSLSSSLSVFHPYYILIFH